MTDNPIGEGIKELLGIKPKTPIIPKRRHIGGVDFEELQRQRVQIYRTIEFNLATARTDHLLDFTGNYFYVYKATDIDAEISIRLNEQSMGLIPFHKGRGIRAPFHRLFVTNAAQAGKTLSLAIGVESETFEIFDVGKALEITGVVEVAQNYEVGDWATEGVKVNPTNGTLLADTGSLVAGLYDIDIIYTTSANAGGDIQHRNADNTVTVACHRVRGFTYSSFCFPLRSYKIATNERFRVIQASDLTGSVQVSIIYVRRA
ncbi:MAG: hypothetical protein HWN68_16600 [Desulfobacterales bacterium]|nr:hypothetical protein [Desulfobacterales bacterium]